MATSTPWGTADHSDKVARGIVFYGTPSHGGYHLSPTRNTLVHEAWRDKGGWYEEDCDWAIVVLTFPECFKASTIEHATATAKAWHPDAYTAVTGEPVALAESSILRGRAFAAAHVDDYIVTAAWGDWHASVPDGMVGVVAVRGGRLATGAMASTDEAYFLVPETEYTSGGFGFVVDPARHARCEPITGCATKRLVLHTAKTRGPRMASW
jgi:hypothetical protein